MVTASLLALRNLLWNRPDEVQYIAIKAPERKVHTSRNVTVFKVFPFISPGELWDGF
jgi:hypothetical protein